MSNKQMLENPDATYIKVSYYGDLSEEQKKKVMATLPKGVDIKFQRAKRVNKADFDRPISHDQAIKEVSNRTGMVASYNKKPKKKNPVTPKKKLIKKTANKKKR